MNSPIQRILVPLDPSEYARAATLRACEVAKTHMAQVEGFVVLDTPEIRSHVAPLEMQNWPAVVDAMAKAVDEAREQIEDVRKRFVETCESLHTTHQEVQVEGLPPNLILEASALFDLVVVGMRTYFQFETQEGPGDSLTRILDRTVTPVLAVPTGEADPIKRVVVAYDGSMGSARALRDFVAFARPYNFEITVFSAHEDEDRAKGVAEQAGSYLRAHDLTDFQVKTSTKSAFAAFESQFLGKTDLVVSGIHSRKFFKDAFVGSFANQLIESGKTSLFLSH